MSHKRHRIISIRPHHLLNFYLSYRLKNGKLEAREPEDMWPRYGEEYWKNVERLCRTLFSEDVDVELKLSGRDSICLPEKSELCKECLKRKKSYDEFKRVYYELHTRVWETENLLYFGLRPGKYGSKEIVKAIEETGRKLKDVLGENLPENIAVSLVYTTDSRIEPVFPEVVRVRKTRYEIEGFRIEGMEKGMEPKELYLEFRRRYGHLLRMDDRTLFETLLNSP